MYEGKREIEYKERKYKRCNCKGQKLLKMRNKKGSSYYKKLIHYWFMKRFYLDGI